jgi:hypothetical protein
MIGKDYGLMVKRLEYTRQLFEDIDLGRLPSLEKEPYVNTNDETTRRRISEVLKILKPLESELIFENSGKYSLFKIGSPEKLNEKLSNMGISYNPDETYGMGYVGGSIQITNLTGLKNTRVNALVRHNPEYTEGVLRRFIPKDLLLEFLLID